jgi:hypothetical protein
MWRLMRTARHREPETSATCAVTGERFEQVVPYRVGYAAAGIGHG